MTCSEEEKTAWLAPIGKRLGLGNGGSVLTGVGAQLGLIGTLGVFLLREDIGAR